MKYGDGDHFIVQYLIKVSSQLWQLNFSKQISESVYIKIIKRNARRNLLLFYWLIQSC